MCVCVVYAAHMAAAHPLPTVDILTHHPHSSPHVRRKSINQSINQQ